jgi:hypothetical protein
MWWAFLASALAGSYQHQGRLLDVAGAPVDGSHTLTFSVHDSATGTAAALWSGQHAIDVVDGYYAVVLDIPDNQLVGQRWFEVRVGTSAPLPRTLIGQVPGASSGGSAGGQPAAGTLTPLGCSPSNAGVMWYDASVPSLKVCNGASYVTFASVAAPPGPPASSTVVPGDGFLDVSWPAVTDATAYQVAWSPGTALGGSPTLITVSSGTTTRINGLTNGSNYATAVRTVAGSWTSAYTTPVVASPSPIPPRSCRERFLGGATVDGPYTVDPDGLGPLGSQSVWCDMQNGGWTLVMRAYAGDTTGWSTSTDLHVERAATGPNQNATFRLSNDAINGIRGATGIYKLRSDGTFNATRYVAANCTYVHDLIAPNVCTSSYSDDALTQDLRTGTQTNDCRGISLYPLNGSGLYVVTNRCSALDRWWTGNGTNSYDNSTSTGINFTMWVR